MQPSNRKRIFTTFNLLKLMNYQFISMTQTSCSYIFLNQNYGVLIIIIFIILAFVLVLLRNMFWLLKIANDFFSLFSVVYKPEKKWAFLSSKGAAQLNDMSSLSGFCTIFIFYCCLVWHRSSFSHELQATASTLE